MPYRVMKGDESIAVFERVNVGWGGVLECNNEWGTRTMAIYGPGAWTEVHWESPKE